MSRLDIKTPSRAQTVVEGLYRDVERRIAASPPGLCPVEMSLSFLQLCHAQTCGKCVPCRIGLGQLSELMELVLEGKATMVIGNRRTDSIEHFSPLKKKLQKLGSGVVRKASGTDVVDTTSGFRSYTREAAMRLNVLSDYTYTLETIITAGADRTKIMSVDINTNPELRKSRLFKSMWGYIKRSSGTIIRNYVMRKPLKTFLGIAAVFVLAALVLAVRFIVYACLGEGGGHIQSLVLMAVLAIVGFQIGIFGLVADAISGCRRVMDETLFHVKRIEYNNTNSNYSNYNLCSYNKEEIDKK